jgi:hypothetical protein
MLCFHIVVIRTKVPLGVVQAVNGNIKALRRGRGYRNLNLPAAESTAAGRHQDPIHRFTEGRLKDLVRFSCRTLKPIRLDARLKMRKASASILGMVEQFLDAGKERL